MTPRIFSIMDEIITLKLSYLPILFGDKNEGKGTRVNDF